MKVNLRVEPIDPNLSVITPYFATVNMAMSGKGLFMGHW